MKAAEEQDKKFVKNPIGKKPRPDAKAPRINRRFHFFFLPADPRPHYPYHHPNAPQGGLRRALQRLPGCPEVSRHSLAESSPTLPQVSVWDPIHLNLYTRSQVPSVLSPRGVSTFPGLRLTRQTYYSSRIQNVTFVYAPAPPFKYPQRPISESFVTPVGRAAHWEL